MWSKMLWHFSLRMMIVEAHTTELIYKSFYRRCYISVSKMICHSMSDCKPEQYIHESHSGWMSLVMHSCSSYQYTPCGRHSLLKEHSEFQQYQWYRLIPAMSPDEITGTLNAPLVNTECTNGVTNYQEWATPLDIINSSSPLWEIKMMSSMGGGGIFQLEKPFSEKGHRHTNCMIVLCMNQLILLFFWQYQWRCIKQHPFAQLFVPISSTFLSVL